MGNLFYNLSEEDISKSRQILLWGFSGLFFLGGVYVLIVGPVFGKTSISPILSLAPFGISLVVSIIAAFATIKRSDLFFSVDDDKIEFRYGLIKPKKHKYMWADIQEITMPSKQRKAMLQFKDGSSYVINLNWIEKRKSSIIKKHIFHAARIKNLNVKRVVTLVKRG